MISTTGFQLLPQEAVQDLRQLLLPSATVLTPNVPEARLLLSDAGKQVVDPQSVDDLIAIAKAVQSLGPKYVLVKGGHLPFKKDGTVAKEESEREVMFDILYGEGHVTRIETNYQNSKNTHGTGCSLACESASSSKQFILMETAAIASNLANGMDVIRAVKQACRYVEAGIRTSTDLGKGNGPINHFHSTYTLPFAP
jgi:hydroxymethylpyrimidine kinase/phosphomethylpyrimidine kinase